MHPSTGKRVLIEKPRRGREILTRDMPDILNDDKNFKLKPYHEGYVNEQKYLVPDTNLEAMKTLIDFKSKRRYGRRYLQEVEPESEQQTYSRYQTKYNRMYDKIHSDEEEDIEQEETEDDEEEKVDEESEVDEEETDVEDLEAEEKKEIMPTMKTDIPSKVNRKSTDENREVNSLRFLLSGHLRKNMKPLFIVQKYEGKSPLDIENRETLSTYSQDNVDIFISGKFYKESILEEEDNKLKSLKIEHKKIKIDELSKVYEPQLSEIFSTGDIDILVTGRFLENQQTNTYTPFFQFKVNRKVSVKRKSRLTKNNEDKRYSERNKSIDSSMSKGDVAHDHEPKLNPTMVYMSTPQRAYHSGATIYTQKGPEQCSVIGDFNSVSNAKREPEIDCFPNLINIDVSEFVDKGSNNNNEFKEKNCVECILKSLTMDQNNRSTSSNTQNDKIVPFFKPLQTPANKRRESIQSTNLNTDKNEQKHEKQKLTIYKRSMLKRCVHTIGKKISLTNFHPYCTQVKSSPEKDMSTESLTGTNVTEAKKSHQLLKTKRFFRRRKTIGQLTEIPRPQSRSNGNVVIRPSPLPQGSTGHQPAPNIEEQAVQMIITSKEKQAKKI